MTDESLIDCFVICHGCHRPLQREDTLVVQPAFADGHWWHDFDRPSVMVGDHRVIGYFCRACLGETVTTALPAKYDGLQEHIRELLCFHTWDKNQPELVEECRRTPGRAARVARGFRLIIGLRRLRGTPEADELNRLVELMFPGGDDEAQNRVISDWHWLQENFHNAPINRAPLTARQYLREAINIVYRALPAARRFRHPPRP